MSISRSALIGGPCTASYNAGAFHFADDLKATFDIDTEDLQTQMYGSKANAYFLDRRVKVNATPLEYANLAILFPYLNYTYGAWVLKTAGADLPLVLNAQAGDIVTVIASIITKMPSLHLGVEKPPIGDVEWTGVVGDGLNPEGAASYFSISSGSYTPIALTAANAMRQRYTGAWGTRTGFTAIQAQAGWDIDWELMLEPEKIQGVTVDFKFLGLRGMAKCVPVGPTAAQINTQLRMQNTGAAQGVLAGASVDDLVITGSGVSVTMKKTALKGAGFVFGGKPLRNGEVGWMTTVDLSSGTPSAVAVIA